MATNEKAVAEFMTAKPIESRLYLILYYDSVEENDIFMLIEDSFKRII